MTPGSRKPELTPAIGDPSLVTTSIEVPDSFDVSVEVVLSVVTTPNVATGKVPG